VSHAYLGRRQIILEHFRDHGGVHASGRQVCRVCGRHIRRRLGQAANAPGRWFDLAIRVVRDRFHDGRLWCRRPPARPISVHDRYGDGGLLRGSSRAIVTLGAISDNEGVAMSDTIAEVRSWNDLHAALRARAESLNVSRLVLDELSGLQSGYASKLLAPVPMRHFGRVSLGAMLGALGLKLVVQEDKEALARIAGRLVRRERNVPRRGQDARPSNVRF
jgi:hypothetical protein